MVWNHSAAKKEVYFGIGSANDVLGQGISQLKFTGYEADGTTQTIVTADIHSVKCEVACEMPGRPGEVCSVTCWAWLRSW